MTQQDFFNRYNYNPRTAKLGGGSFGKVFKAYDQVLDKYVAIKVAEQLEVDGKVFSLIDEFNALQDVPDNKNIAKYEQHYSFDSPQGVFDYAIMQYYPDGNLSQLIASEQLTMEQKESIALQLLDGILFLHQNKVVHRDLKPSNILIHNRILNHKKEYIPKITDFGLSKKANTGKNTHFTNSFAAGTYAYSSPEQLKGEDLRFNTDLWAYGAIVYEIFTGKTMFTLESQKSGSSALNTKEILDLIFNSDISLKIAELPLKWQPVVVACLNRDANNRVKTADELLSILENKTTASSTKATEILPLKNKTLQGNHFSTAKTEILGKTETEKTVLQNQNNMVAKKSKKTLLYFEIGILVFVILGLLFLQNIWFMSSEKFDMLQKKYDRILTFHDGLAGVVLNDKYGYIDGKGNEIISLKYDDADEFREGLAEVTLDNKSGFIDKSGKEIIPFKYDDAFYFSEGLASVELNNKWGIIDKTGKEIIPFIYDSPAVFSEGLASVKLNDKYGFMDKTGKEIILFIYDDAYGFSERLAVVKLNGKYGFIDKQGTVVVPIKYDDASSFDEGLASVKLNGKWGLIDKQGTVVIPIKYDFAFSFDEGLAVVHLNNIMFSINKKGECVQNCP